MLLVADDVVDAGLLLDITAVEVGHIVCSERAAIGYIDFHETDDNTFPSVIKIDFTHVFILAAILNGSLHSGCIFRVVLPTTAKTSEFKVFLLFR